MRFLVSRVLKIGLASQIAFPLGTETTEDGAKRAAQEEAKQLQELLKLPVTTQDGRKVPVSAILGSIGVMGISCTIEAIDPDELIQLAGAQEMREINQRGKLVG